MKLDAQVTKRLERARARHANWKPRWAECLAMWEGRQFVVRAAASNRISELETREFGSKEPHRARLSRNRLFKYVMAEVSLGTQRTPQYEVVPTTTDPEDIAAAHLSEKVLMYLYDFLSVRKYLVEAYQYAVNTGEGFIRPYWNPKGGDPLPDPTEEGQTLYTGEIAMDTYGPQEVIWESGARFEKSLWHAIETTMSIDEAKALPDFLPDVELKPDSRSYDSFTTGQLTRSGARPNSIGVTEYLELPSDANPKGRRFWVAGGKESAEQITATKPYPIRCPGPSGYEPCIQKISYVPTPHRDRDMGLTEHLLDPQRTLNDCMNKAVEWKNLAIAPQLLAPVGSMRGRPTNKPGAVREYQPIAGQKPEWQQVPDIPMSLFKLAEAAVEDMEQISSLQSVPTNVDSGKGIAAFTERDQSVRAFIVQALADFHSRLGKVLLYLVQENYTEPRLLAIQGRNGLDFIPDFKGSSLRQQINVRVLPGSIEPRTRAAVEQKVLSFADRGWVSPEQAMAAIDGGTADSLVEDYELDVAKQQRENQAMIALAQPNMPGGEVPDAKPFDHHSVHLYELHKWMKTKDFERQPEVVQQAATLHEQQHQQLEAQAQAQAQAAQTQQAQELGMANATRPSAKPMPDQPKPSAG